MTKTQQQRGVDQLRALAPIGRIIRVETTRGTLVGEVIERTDMLVLGQHPHLYAIPWADVLTIADAR